MAREREGRARRARTHPARRPPPRGRRACSRPRRAIAATSSTRRSGCRRSDGCGCRGRARRCAWRRPRPAARARSASSPTAPCPARCGPQAPCIAARCPGAATWARPRKSTGAPTARRGRPPAARRCAPGPWRHARSRPRPAQTLQGTGRAAVRSAQRRHVRGPARQQSERARRGEAPAREAVRAWPGMQVTAEDVATFSLWRSHREADLRRASAHLAVQDARCEGAGRASRRACPPSPPRVAPLSLRAGRARARLSCPACSRPWTRPWRA